MERTAISRLLYTPPAVHLGYYSRGEGAYSARAGEVSHLKSDFFFSLPNPEKLGDVLQLLHPTPAVCGLPKEEAYHSSSRMRGTIVAILRFHRLAGSQRQNRSVRKPPLHEYPPPNLTLYAGGGLLAASQLEDEWQETEDKLDTMRRIVGNL